MKILGLIPARGGSKRLPGKNIKILGDLPLIAWTIRAALQSQILVDVMISTDDSEIAEISKSYGASVFSHRPAELATDVASSIDVAIHALTEYEDIRGRVDGLMLLQPTSPFRTVETIKQAASIFESTGGLPVVGVSNAESHPSWCYYIKSECLVPVVESGQICNRSQDLPPAYVVNGVMYLIAPKTLRMGRTFISSDTSPLIISNRIESLDIDTEWDWMLANTILQNFDLDKMHSPTI